MSDIDARQSVAHIEVEVRYVGLRRFCLRLVVGLWLMRLGAWMIGCRFISRRETAEELEA